MNSTGLSRLRSAGRASGFRFTSQTAFQPDLSFLLNPMNRGSIIQNLIKRNGDTLEHAEKAYQEMVSAKEIMTKTPSAESRSALVRAASKFPNMTHPAVLDLESPKEIYQSDKWKPKFSPDPDKHQVSNICIYCVKVNNNMLSNIYACLQKSIFKNATYVVVSTNFKYIHDTARNNLN